MINIPKKIADDMQKELNKLEQKFDVQYMSARVNSLDAVTTKFDSGKKRLAKQKTAYTGAMIISPNISSVYSKPGTMTFDGNFNIVFAIDHKSINPILAAISQFAHNINGLYLVDKKDNTYRNKTQRDLKGLRRKYKTSVGIEGGAMNGASTLYQTYTLTIGVHVSNQIKGDDYKFTLVDVNNNNEETSIDELVRTDLGGEDTESNTEANKAFYGTLVNGAKEQYTFTRFVNMKDKLTNELLDLKFTKNIRSKYILKREIFDVDDNDEYVAVRTDLYKGKLTNPTQVFDKGKEALISFYFEVDDLYDPVAEALKAKEASEKESK